MVIELWGLPGCGKSAAAEYLASRLRAHGISVTTPSADVASLSSRARWVRKAWMVLVLFMRAPRRFYAVRKLVANSQQASFRDGVTAFLDLVVSQSRPVPMQENSIAIYDQGLLQALVTTCFASNLDATPQLHDAIQLPDCAVRMKCSQDTVTQRLLQREEQLSRVQRDIATGIRNTNHILDKISISPWYQAISFHWVIENDGTIGSMNKQVDELVYRLLRGTEGPDICR